MPGENVRLADCCHNCTNGIEEYDKEDGTFYMVCTLDNQAMIDWAICDDFVADDEPFEGTAKELLQKEYVKHQMLKEKGDKE